MSTDAATGKNDVGAVPPPPRLPGETPDRPSRAALAGDRDTPSSQTRSSWTYWHTFGLVAIVIAVGLVGMKAKPVVAFLATLTLLVAFTAIAGHGVVGLWRGLLIDEQNRLSLSRLQ